jgi:hypothetical protein
LNTTNFKGQLIDGVLDPTAGGIERRELIAEMASCQKHSDFKSRLLELGILDREMTTLRMMTLLK